MKAARAKKLARKTGKVLEPKLSVLKWNQDIEL